MMWRGALATGAALTALAGSASNVRAADRAAPAPAMVKLLACRPLADAAQRLACFDREAAALGGDVSAGNVVVVDKAQVRAAERASFGLAPPGLDLFAGQDGARLAKVEAVAKAGSIDQFGKAVVSLADGSRWRQIDDVSLMRAPRAGDKVLITRAAIGSFKMAIAGQTAIRVRREQ